MPKRIIVLSGRVCSGKSAIADSFVEQFDAKVLKTKELIAKLYKGTIASERHVHQRYGERLDQKTGGQWVAEALTREVESLPENALVIVDAVRVKEQVRAIRRAYGSRVVHVHLTADLSVLRERYKRKQRDTGFKEFDSYEELWRSKTERNIEDLAETADVVIGTDACRKEDVVVRAAARLGLYGRECRRLVDVLVGGAYGSEGKGHIASYLSPEYDLLVRVGGPNAGHKVFEDPEPYVHHLLPSGTRRCNADLLIGPGAVLSLDGILKEISECSVSADRLSIDPHAMIIEPEDVEYEKKTLVGSIGSTGQGVGAATARKLLRGAIKPAVRLAGNIPELKPFIEESAHVLERAYRDSKKVLLEGTQGVGLSLHHGRYPHVTSRDTTVSGCLSESGIPPHRVRKVVMVCRTFPIRVKSPSKRRTSGPMAQQLTWKQVADISGYDALDLERAEHTSTTHKLRRVGRFEWDLLHQGVQLNAPTDIAISFADYIDSKNAGARRYELLTPDTIRFIEEVEYVSCAPVSLISTRFNYRSIIDRRAW